MTRTFCDRCGKEIKPISTMKIYHVEYRHRVLLFKDFYTENRLESYICEECGNSFCNWFNHPERDERQKA